LALNAVHLDASTQTVSRARRRAAAFLKPSYESFGATFYGRWIGRGGSILWPDMTPFDSFFWGYVKNYIYMHQVRDLNNMKAKIREADEQVRRDLRLSQRCL
jgi:hypothetical protein